MCRCARENAASRQMVSITAWLKPRHRVRAKIISLLITITFFFPCLTWAFEAETYPKPANQVMFNNQLIKISPQIGTITESFQGGNRMVVCVQDLHCNYEVQNNIVKIIDMLAGRHDLRLVAVEGAAMPLNVTKLSTFPIAAVKEMAAHYLMKQGKICGAEVYAATGKHPIRLEGIETRELYEKNRTSVAKFLNNESQGCIFDLREMLQESKDKVYNTALSRLDKRKMEFRKGGMSLLEYSVYLYRYGRRCLENLEAYPNLRAYVSKQKHIFSEEVDPDGLFNELDQLDQRLRAGLYTTSAQAAMDDLQRCLDIMEKLLNISVSQEELAAYRAAPKGFTVQRFLDDIARQVEPGEIRLGTEVYKLDSYLEEAMNFYQVADERSLAFVENTLRRMSRHNTNISLLVTGGFHTNIVLSELRRQEISYLCVKPRLRHYDIANPYFALLMNRRTPLEKLLARNQNILAIKPASPETGQDPQALMGPGRLTPKELKYYDLTDTVVKVGTLACFINQGVRSAKELLVKYEEKISAYAANNSKIALFPEKLKLEAQTVIASFTSGITTVIHKHGNLEPLPKGVVRLEMFGRKALLTAAGTEKKIMAKLSALRLPELRRDTRQFRRKSSLVSLALMTLFLTFTDSAGNTAGLLARVAAVILPGKTNFGRKITYFSVRDSLNKVAVDLSIDNRKSDPIVLAAYQASDAGIEMEFKDSSEELQIELAGKIKPLYDRSNEQRGISFSLKTNNRSRIIINPLMDSMRALREHAKGESAERANVLARYSEYLGRLSEGTKQKLEKAGVPPSVLSAQVKPEVSLPGNKIIITKPTLDRRNKYRLQITLPPHCQAHQTPEGMIEITSQNNQPVSLAIKASTDFEPLRPLSPE